MDMETEAGAPEKKRGGHRQVNTVCVWGGGRRSGQGLGGTGRVGMEGRQVDAYR